jgi:hypothetical protein
MRRVFSILLMLVLGVGPVMASVPASALAVGLLSAVATAFPSSSAGKLAESHLPACCRRNGKHHCEMTSPGSVDAATNVSASDSCPCMPRSLAPVIPTAAEVVAGGAQWSEFSTHILNAHSNASPALTGNLRTWPQRGPPASSLL